MNNKTKEADDFLTSVAEYQFSRLTDKSGLEFWFWKCRVDGGKLIQAGVI